MSNVWDDPSGKKVSHETEMSMLFVSDLLKYIGVVSKKSHPQYLGKFASMIILIFKYSYSFLNIFCLSR